MIPDFQGNFTMTQIVYNMEHFSISKVVFQSKCTILNSNLKRALIRVRGTEKSHGPRTH